MCMCYISRKFGPPNVVRISQTDPPRLSLLHDAREHFSTFQRTPRSPRQHGAQSRSMSRPLLPESAYEALGLSPQAIKDLMNPKPVPEPPPEIHAPNLLQSDEDNARPMLPNETSITLYAELLLHIRTVTLFASLRANNSKQTDAKLSADGSFITVSHEGESATIRLPINVKGGGDAALELPSQPPNKELTLRLQVEEQEGSDLLGALRRQDRQANIVPWDGASLNDAQDVEIVCKSCQGILVPKGNIQQWRDLPNENWAEMMDFWHCHKPDEHHLHDHTHEHAVGQKGYAAGNRLQAAQGIGFVDLASFLLVGIDCEGAQVSYTSIISAGATCALLPLCAPRFRAQRRQYSPFHGIIVDTTAPEEQAVYVFSAPDVPSPSG